MIRLLHQIIWAINLVAVLCGKTPQEFLPVSSTCIILLRDYKVLINSRKCEVMQDSFSTSICFLKKEKSERKNPKTIKEQRTYNSILYTEAQLVF